MTPQRGTAVLAGCGDLGTRVGLALAAAGYRVLGLRRHPEHLPAPIIGQPVDLRDQEPLLPRTTTLLIGALTTQNRTAAGYRETYLGGLCRMLDAVDGQLDTPPRVVWVSSTAVYGVADGSWIDETTPAVPTSATGSVLREAEDLLHDRLPSATVLRLAGLYGPGHTRLLDSVRNGEATVTAGPVYTNRIHRADAAAAITHLSMRVPDPEPCYLGVDDQPVEYGELVGFLADELGVARPRVTETVSGRGRGKRCRNDRLRATGFAPAYPTYRHGYRALLSAG